MRSCHSLARANARHGLPYLGVGAEGAVVDGHG